MRLDVARAHAAFAPIAARLGTDIPGAAAAAIRLTVANIVRAMQLVSTERGRDPRDYALLPFGGAGPLLAAEIAEELGVPEILVPPNPGVISALGLLSADFMKVAGVTRRTPLDETAPGILRETFARFQADATAEFHGLGLDGALDFSLTADMRFVGQAFEIPVDIEPRRIGACISMAASLGGGWRLWGCAAVCGAGLRRCRNSGNAPPRWSVRPMSRSGLAARAWPPRCAMRPGWRPAKRFPAPR